MPTWIFAHASGHSGTRLRGCHSLPAYNPCMLHDPSSTLSSVASATLDRMTLVANHWLRAEPAAVAKLRPHHGRRIDARAVVLPLLPWAAKVDSAVGMVWVVTPAGLLEREDTPSGLASDLASGGKADATLSVLSQSVTQWVRDAAHDDFSWVLIDANEALQADLRWVIENVRWDVAGDVGRWLPAAVAGPAAQVAERAVEGVKRGVRALDAWWPGRGPTP